MSTEIRVSQRGALRWTRQHPWIFASDLIHQDGPPGIVVVSDQRGKRLGKALYSPSSEIRLRLLDRRADVAIDADWWTDRLREALARRDGIDATAYRVVHGEGDGLPSLVIDRYDRWVAVQLLSAGLESCRADILVAIERVLAPEGILLRNDAPVRRHEGLAEEVVVAAGQVPDEVEVREGQVRYLVPLRTGQKTGAFLDQRSNRFRAAAAMPEGGTGLDCFSYHGSFALHLARRARQVVALDSSAGALERGQRNAQLNGLDNIEWHEADAFDALRDMDRERIRFDVVVVDPPAFAKSKASLPKALRGYKDINLHAMRLVRPGGSLVSASCSFHVRWPDFLAMIGDAAVDSGRRVTMLEHLSQPVDHPEILTIPETGYLKGVVLRID
ncbi:MAG: class I SAM-dependent rRNA methyltransferase [Gemmatimonadales bacterium]